MPVSACASRIPARLPLPVLCPLPCSIFLRVCPLSRDGVAPMPFSADFYQFYIERDQLPPELQQTASPPCKPGRPAAHSAPALCVGMAGSASLDSPSGRGGAVLCRSPTSTFKLCELEEPPATFKLPSPLSVEEYHEFDT
mmetsp:Transcript_33534/g.83762  ORF Transcript_33534/g.83762 Transcript_33534/m.83762 type:complete len:140 (-) Transcript_33534:121-540(-)